MSAVKEAREITPGEWIEYGPGKYDLGEIERITACFPTIDPDTGRRIMGKRRFHIMGGKTIDHYPHAMIAVF